MRLLLLGASEAVCLLYIHHLSTGAPPDPLAFLAAALAAYLAYLGAVAVVMRRPPSGSVALTAILAAAVAFRLILWLDPLPLFDDDLYRYLWDGKVLTHGVNPYRYAPAAPELAGLRDPGFYHVGYPAVPTVYPPLAQLTFAASALLVPGSLHSLKAFFVLADLATIGLLLSVLQRLGYPLVLVLIYAWHPLPIKEFADSGHLDTLAVACTWLALALALSGERSRRSDLAASLALGGATLAKLYPLLLAPFLFRRIGWRYAVPCVALVVAGYLPFLWGLPWTRMVAGLVVYGRYWEFNSSLFALVRLALANWVGLDPMAASMGARLLAIGVLAMGGLWLYRAGGDRPADLLYRCAALLALLFLVSPTVDPWYVCALIPFLCVFRARSWLLLSGLLFLSYGYYIDRTLDPWFRVLEYTPFYLMLLMEARSRRGALWFPKGE